MRRTTMTLALLAATALAGSAMAQMAPMAPAAPAAPAAPPAPITAARPAANVALDANRKPIETMAFAGVKPGMTVAELGPGGGYYTRMLSQAVGPRGKVYTVLTPGQAARPNGRFTADGLAAVLPNVVVVVSEYATLTLPTAPDLVWTTENYHDYHNGPTANVAALNKGVYNALKPGGIYYVEDHSAAKGAGLEAASKVHRMDEDIAKTELMAAGFKLDAEGQLLRHPEDNKVGSNSETGHYLSDRFMLRMKK
jgi:predicted methyltransferase